MAFEAEDGTGNSEAVSYCSVEFADAYHAAAGNAAWTGLEQAKKEQALVAATRWIENNYRGQWLGYVLTTNQALAWPRAGIVDPQTGVTYPLGWFPKALAEATAELADEARQGKLYANADPSKPALTEKTVGPITYKYAPQSPNTITAQKNFENVRQMLVELVGGRGLRLTSVRA